MGPEAIRSRYRCKYRGFIGTRRVDFSAQAVSKAAMATAVSPRSPCRSCGRPHSFAERLVRRLTPVAETVGADLELAHQPPQLGGSRHQILGRFLGIGRAA